MEKWQVFAIIGVVMLIIEILTPTLFFLNIAIAGFITMFFAFFIDRWDYLIYIMIAWSGLMLFFLYPVLVKRNKKNDLKTGMDKYIGQKAKVLEKVTKKSGAVSVFDERWNARIEDGKSIDVGEEAVIYRSENLTLFVRKDD